MSLLSPYRLGFIRGRTEIGEAGVDMQADLLAHIDALEAENQRLREAAGKLRRDVAAEYVDAMPVTIHNALVDFDHATRTSDEGEGA